MGSPYDGMNGEFVGRLQAFQNGARQAGFTISLTSGYRSPERQAELWAEALRKYGDPEIADNWVARPGKSNHGHGLAGDLGFSNAAAREWAHANAGRYGLHFPMSWEPWHIEPIGIQGSSDRGAYTTPPAGQVHPADVENDPYDIGTQFQNFLGAMSLDKMVDAGMVSTPEMTGETSPMSAPEPEVAMGDVVEELAVP